MDHENPNLEAFEASDRQPGESVLCWVVTVEEEGAGAAILTDRRLCRRGPDGKLAGVPVTGRTLRYAPRSEGDFLTAAFETDAGPLEFSVRGEEEIRHLGNLLGNLAELREAQRKLEEAGIDPDFMSPPREAGAEGVSAVYQLIRLKEMLNQGLFSEIEFAMQRTVMIGRFLDQSSGQVSEPN